MKFNLCYRKINQTELREDLAKLDGKPPYNTGSNILQGDGYFAKSLEEKYGLPIEELRQIANKAVVER